MMASGTMVPVSFNPRVLTGKNFRVPMLDHSNYVLSSVYRDVEDHGGGRLGVLLPWAPVFEFERQHTIPLRPEFPQFRAAGSSNRPPGW